MFYFPHLPSSILHPSERGLEGRWGQRTEELFWEKWVLLLLLLINKQSKERKEVGKLDPNEYIPEFRVLKKGSTLGP